MTVRHLNRGAGKPRPRCVFCGKPYGSRWTEEKRIVVDDGAPPPHMPTNGILVRSEVRSYGSYQTQYRQEVWDGETFSGGQPPFCTNACAHEFACEAFLAGFRARKK